MKRGLVLTVIIGILLVMVKYYIADYDIEYKINNYDIKTVYKDKRLYYEIMKGKEIYNFEIYTKRKLSKTKIEKIKEIKDETISCIYPIIKDIETYPLCYENGIYKDYNLIESELLLEYKNEKINVEKSEKDFVYEKEEKAQEIERFNELTDARYHKCYFEDYETSYYEVIWYS